MMSAQQSYPSHARNEWRKRIITFFRRLLIRLVLRSFTNRYLGRKIFYNDGGLVSNVIGNYVRRRDARKMRRLGLHFPRDNAVASELMSKGFSCGAGTANSQVIAELQRLWECWIAERERPASGRLELSSADRLVSAQSFLPPLAKLITEDIQAALYSYFQSYFRILNFHIYRNYRPNSHSLVEAYGATGNWHTDGSTAESIKLFFMLSPIDNRSGPMQIISKEDTIKVIRSNSYRNPDTSGVTAEFIEKNCSIEALTGRSGNFFYAATNDVLHRATFPENSKTRDLLVFYISSSTLKVPVIDQLESAIHREVIGTGRLLIK